MVKELATEKTLVSIEDMLKSLYMAWISIFNEQPKKSQLLVLLSQGAFETGRFKQMYNYNIGNIKSTKNDNRSYTFYTCTEILPLDKANTLLKNKLNDGGDVKIIKYMDNSCVVCFYPKHYACKFRAFETLEEGSIDYLSFLKIKYSEAWNYVLSSDPFNFCIKLKHMGYYTADEQQYTNSVLSIYNEFSKIDLDTSSLPILSDEQKQRILDLVTISLQDLSNQLNNQ